VTQPAIPLDFPHRSKEGPIMRRWLSCLFIAGYLGSLCLGISSQALKFGTMSHPAMYFVIWDMFCGWSTFEARYHLIAEGESGTHYWLAPGPWGDFQPYGDIDRNHYDYHGNGLLRMAQNTLRHSEHEPIRRIISVEECWPKKYNLPDHLWAMRCAEPKDPISYFWVRNVYTADGQPLQGRPSYLTQLYTESIFKNPRLQADAKRGQQVFAVNPYDRFLATPGARLENVSPMVTESLESLPSAN